LKNVSKILVLVLVLSLFTNVALAEVEVNDRNVELVERIVERTNESILKDVERAQENSEMIIEYLGDNYLSRLVIDLIIDSLVYTTNAKADAAIEIGEKLGVTVICVYEDYFIGYKWVEIDPLYVIAD